MASNANVGNGLEPLCRIITPIGMLGYGFDEFEIKYALESSIQSGIPAAIILDSGSTDSGPAKLALGTMTCPRASYERDLRKLVATIIKYRFPVLIGSAGGDGSNAHVKELVDLVKEILASSEYNSTQLKVIAIYSDIDCDLVLERLEAGGISGCGPCVPHLTAEDVKASKTIVGQMGPEPYIRAMASHPDFDIIIGGRSYDPAPYVAFSAYHAFNQRHGQILSLDSRTLGGFTHMGKIMECGGLCATPKSPSCQATIYRDGTFDVRPLMPGALCSPTTVAAHTLYEKSRPDRLYGPGGYIDLSASTYTTLSDKCSVRVTGTTFHSSKGSGDCYTVKLESAKIIGYRTMFMGSFIDPILISQLHSLLHGVKSYVTQQHSHISEKWEIGFHTYGYDEANKTAYMGNIFVVAEAVAETQATATSIASTARVACIHGPYEGQKATSGNFGFGLGGKGEIEAGPCAEFSIYHLMELEEEEEDAFEINQQDKRAKKHLFSFEALLIGVGDRVQRCSSRLHNNFTSTPGDMFPQLTPDDAWPNTAEVPFILPHTVGEAAKVIRSKNAGPYEITFDIIFNNKETYDYVRNTGLLQTDLIAKLYNLSVDDIVYCGFFDQALAFKATIPRTRNGKPVASGGFMEDDVHGSQRYLPLMNLRLDIMG
ncbi:hypothetical protein M441DRAFT_32500 [Trichoderma asperellum CBS 433.97]|uniref:Uncharacterized protein n=1 Tax=Trichoderma asperellum (strain ATCC 204424 / CBS 433.97 / NBRC 101777) TaxID=1042311 RepID=A0A2T3YQD2_TRIA4|nr:hypothetical protein M441DRAFT_32500 [Trichoderma asperellum CBS 433.97]PTB34778.1 hypothetical protein M441DRAFT_32500 [Trichoderma asperellum CBS 433.97]